MSFLWVLQVVVITQLIVLLFLSVLLEFQDSARSWLQWRKGRMYRVVIV